MWVRSGDKRGAVRGRAQAVATWQSFHACQPCVVAPVPGAGRRSYAAFRKPCLRLVIFQVGKKIIQAGNGSFPSWKLISSSLENATFQLGKSASGLKRGSEGIYVGQRLRRDSASPSRRRR